ncbi:MAG: Flp pilus assembly complex ATPase component TadA [Betaproteobacteria bacterium]|nr:Flp pilus assembly complex ATPase component TadA [Betaproteobacteria bacterium]
MTDLANPPLSLLPPVADGFAWPTPNLPNYPPAAPSPAPLACQVEGNNGKTIPGHLLEMSLVQRFIQLAVPGARAPLTLRFDQFRRLRLLDPLAPAPGFAGGGVVTDIEHPTIPFSVHFAHGAVWQGQSVCTREEAAGLFLFEPADAHGTVRRTFVPASAYTHVELGKRIGEVLIEQRIATAAQVSAALVEQQDLRERKLGDLLLVHQIIGADELNTAIEQQAKMPMVRIGEALVALGFITEQQLNEALEQQRADRGTPLGELLVRKGLVSRADLQMALARKMGYPVVDVRQFPADTDAVARLPFAVASRISGLPLIVRSSRLVVAMEDPTSRSALEEIEFAARCKVLPVLARAADLHDAIQRAYEKLGVDVGGGPGVDGVEYFEHADATKLAATLEGNGGTDEDEGPSIEQSDNSLVRLINSMILEAHAQGVSDIHIECPAAREKVRIRFRKDGVLKPYLELPPSYRNAMLGRLKIMCDLDISEKRKPQDGKIVFGKFVQGSRLELRVATIPTSGNCEDAVLRLLASSRTMPLGQLELTQDNLERLKLAIARPYGMVLCVGPTGSGKTTTLHSALAHINTPERKIWTAEDPVEITQAGLRQVQVNPKIDWTFAKALRAFLRADPDVIMVGEIRDQETAQVAIEASLTGHLVLSTLHTNSAAETVTRLLDMGMDPFNFADALLAVLAQRLVRRMCTNCRESEPASPAFRDELLHDYVRAFQGAEAAPDEDAVLAGWSKNGRLMRYRCNGCEQCGGSGLRGRAGLHELMTVTRGLREKIQGGKRSDELLHHALADGMRTLRHDGIDKVWAGLTTIEEVRANS